MRDRPVQPYTQGVAKSLQMCDLQTLSIITHGRVLSAGGHVG
jgi:hypothetical protein